MEVSECRVRLLNDDPVCAMASVTFDECFVVKGIRILSIDDRLLVCMPSRRGRNGKYQDLAHPINKESREKLNQQILEAYHREKENESTRKDRDDRYEEADMSLRAAAEPA